MDLLTDAYDDDSNTPKLDENREDSSIMSHHRHTSGNYPSYTAAPVEDVKDSSDSEDESSSDENVKRARRDRRSSDSSRYSGSSRSSSSSSDRSDASKTAKELAAILQDKRLPSTKVSTRRKRFRSASKERRRRRSYERRRRSRSRDRHHKSSHLERKSSHRSRSRSRSRDRHSRRHDRDHRRRDGHRRQHSSRDGHRRRRRSSSSHRHRHHSRSRDHNKSHSDKKRRSPSPPRPSTSAKSEQAPAAVAITSAATAGSSRPPVYKMSGVKRRGTTTGTFKDLVKEQYMQNAQRAEYAMLGNTPHALMGAPQMASSAATVSAGTGVKGGGGVGQVLYETLHNRLQQQHQHQHQQFQPQQFQSQQFQPQLLYQPNPYQLGRPGVLTPEQRARNQKLILQSTGRTKAQVEAQFGIKIPSIYNENTNNLFEIAERELKRKRLFKKKEKDEDEEEEEDEEEGTSAFNALPILPGVSKEEGDKFARLMGRANWRKLKAGKRPLDAAKLEAIQKAFRENEIRTANLQKEYESSRQLTHFARGYGFGYAGVMYQPR